METPIISLNNVTISHDDGPLLSNINLSITPGEFVYLIGRSGAGKTSLLRTLYADHDIDQGEAQVCGFDLTHLKHRQIPLLRRKIGIVFQNFRLLKDRNVFDNLAFVLQATGWKKSEMEAQITKVLTSVGIADKAMSSIHHLSEGEQQRVGIARAIINSPSLILADEPTGNLDSKTSVQIMALFQELYEQGKTIIVVTHEPDIDAYAHSHIVVKDGKLLDYRR